VGVPPSVVSAVDEQLRPRFLKILGEKFAEKSQEICKKIIEALLA
jgi:hypothetical protein